MKIMRLTLIVIKQGGTPKTRSSLVGSRSTQSTQTAPYVVVVLPWKGARPMHVHIAGDESFRSVSDTTCRAKSTKSKNQLNSTTKNMYSVVRPMFLLPTFMHPYNFTKILESYLYYSLVYTIYLPCTSEDRIIK